MILELEKEQNMIKEIVIFFYLSDLFNDFICVFLAIFFIFSC